MAETVGILLAAGSSTRMGENKLLLRIGAKTVLQRSMEAMQRSGIFSRMLIVCREEDVERIDALARAIFDDYELIPGGNERQYSVANALAAAGDADVALVHDAARCFAEPQLFIDCAKAAAEFGAAAAGVHTHDTIKTEQDGVITGTLDRDHIVTIQTPQAARLDILRQAHKQAAVDGFLGTDESVLLERMGVEVRLVEASKNNIKITTQEDIMAGQNIAGARMRCGTGYDAHRLAPGLPLFLGGVKIPYTHGLSGHSDADVLIHAVIDALLGAAAAGDIGHHFPMTETYRGISSVKLLERTREIVAEKGYAIINVDATIVMQKPRLAPYVPQMRKNIAEALCIDIEAVSVKATTTEGMGFEGMQQGVSSMAVAMLTG